MLAAPGRVLPVLWSSGQIVTGAVAAVALLAPRIRAPAGVGSRGHTDAHSLGVVAADADVADLGERHGGVQGGVKAVAGDVDRASTPAQRHLRVVVRNHHQKIHLDEDILSELPAGRNSDSDTQRPEWLEVGAIIVVDSEAQHLIVLEQILLPELDPYFGDSGRFECDLVLCDGSDAEKGTGAVDGQRCPRLGG